MSLRFRTLLLVLVPAVPAVAITILTAWQVRELARAESAERVEEVATFMRANHDLLTEQTELVLRSLARSPAVLEPGEYASAVPQPGEPERVAMQSDEPASVETQSDEPASVAMQSGEAVSDCNEALESVRAHSGRFLGLLRVDRAGTILCRSAETPDVDAIPPDSRSARFLARLTEPGSFQYWGSYLATSGRAVGLFGMRLARPDGSPAGALLAYSDLSQLEEHFGGGSTQDTNAMLLGSDGRIVLHLPPDSSAVGTEVFPELRLEGSGTPEPEVAEAIAAALGLDMIPVVIPVATAEGTPPGAYVAASISGTYLDSTAWVVLRNLSILGVAVLLALGFAYIWSRGAIVRPVERLSAAAGKVGSGDLQTRVGEAGMPGELGLLARAFDRMASKLEEERSEGEHVREALARGEARYRYLFEHNPFPMWVYDLDNLRFLAVNEAAVEHYGYSREELGRMTIEDIRPPSEVGRLHRSLEASRRALVEEDRELEHSGIWTHRRKDGSTLHAEVRSHALELDGRRGKLILALDVSERIETERSLQETQERFEQLMLHTRDVIWIQDADTLEFIYISPAFEGVWGFPVEELQSGRVRFVDTVHPEDRDGTRESRSDLPGDFLQEEYRIVRPDGEVRWILDRSFPIRDAEGIVRRVAGIASDVTDRRQLEDRVRESQRLQAVGRLAGGVAHDFNNLLTVIRGHLHLLQEEALSDAAKEELEGADSAAGRAGRLVRQLLAFSRKQVLMPRVVDLNETLRSARTVLTRVLHDEIELEMDPDPELPPIQVDRVQLEQVLLNLAVNAADAMPGGGTLAFRTHMDRSRGGLSVDGPIPAGDYVVLEVEDSGIGMSETVRSRAFEPFFTTKEPGRGTGLGLAMVFGVVKQSGGFIQVRSEPGSGTRFRILFPPAEVGQAAGPLGFAPEHSGEEGAASTAGSDEAKDSAAR